MKSKRTFLVAILALGFSCLPSHAQFILETSTGLFTPSFRGDSDTTWFGWGEGEFFETPGSGERRRLLNPEPTLGTVGISDGVEFYQLDWTDTNEEVIGSSSNNIYKGGLGAGTKPPVDVVLTAPTSGVVGTGFTTLIIQGISLQTGSFGSPAAFLINQPVFGSINSVAPQFLMAATNDNRAQFWVKYELPGNQASYEISIFLPETANNAPLSISGLTVDTFWSSTEYAPDFAMVPEPSSALLLAFAAAGLAALSRRSRCVHP